MCAHRSSLDPRFAQANARQSLQTFLHLARTNRDIADWLYAASPQSQRATGILSPEVFKRTAALRTLQSCTDLSVPLELIQKSEPYTESFIYDVFLPVKEYDGVNVGYSFHTSMPRRGSSFVRNDIFPSLKTNRGRYAYKKDEKILLIFMEISDTTDVVLYVRWPSATQRSVYYVQVPHRQYGYNDHPKKVLSFVASPSDVLCGALSSSQGGREVRNVPAMTDTAGDEGLPSGPADCVNGDWRADNISSLPQCMFQDLDNRSDSENRYYKDSSAWLNEEQRRLFSGRHTKGLFQLETRKRIIASFDAPTSLMEGNFFSSYVLRDQFDQAGALATRLAFEVRCMASMTDSRCLELLRRSSAQLYYSVVLWASTDQHLVAAQERSAGELLWGKEQIEEC